MDIKNKLTVIRGETWRGKDEPGAWDRHTHMLLYVRQITRKDLLYSTGNPTQGSVKT